MTTINEILTSARLPMRDAAEEFFADAELIDYVNAAIAELASRERLVRESTAVVAAGGGLPIPADFLSVRWVKNPNGEEVAWLDESTFFDYQALNPDWPDDAPLAAIYDDTIWIHPAPANGESWNVGNLAVPAKVTAVGDTFPLRRIWEAKVVAYVQAQMYPRLGEYEMARNREDFFYAGLRPASAVTDHQVPGRINLAREPGIFDTDPEAIHKGV